MVELNQNSTINKTFCICSAESMFLRYKQLSKKAAKLGSSFQCSVDIFLGDNGCIWKINLRILWNHVMQNFQVSYGQCCSIILPPKHLLLKALKLLLYLCLAGSRILYFLYVLKSIHKFIIELHALQYLFVRGLIKSKGGVGLFQISKKEINFIPYDNQVLLRIIS